MAPAKGLRTLTVQRFGFRMESEYVSYHPPSNVGMKMTRYNFACKPRWLAPVAERLGAIILQRDIDRRIQGFARGCTDPLVLESVQSRES